MLSVITLNAQTASDLDWSISPEGDVAWFVDLGLFDQLPKPLDNEMQFRTLELALHHFRDTVWSQYSQQTKAVCLYRGHADFSKQLGGAPLEARDRAAAYLRLLTDCLPDEVPLTLELDVTGVESLLLQAQLLSRDTFDYFELIVEGADIPVYATGKEKRAVCLPEKAAYFSELEEALITLKNSGEPYRIIPESFLTLEWNGLDELIVSTDATSPQGHRKVQGFIAAGGTIISR